MNRIDRNTDIQSPRICLRATLAKARLLVFTPIVVSLLLALSVLVTPAVAAVPTSPGFRNIRSTSVHIQGGIVPGSSEIHWHFEYASAAAGPWSAVPGAQGTISKSEAEEVPSGGEIGVYAGLSGLKPGTVYYVRLFAEDEPEAGVHKQAMSRSSSFETYGPPITRTLAVHALHGETVRILGAVNPNNTPTSNEQVIAIQGAPTGGTFTLTFNGRTSEPIAFNATNESVKHALDAVIGFNVIVFGTRGGPYTVVFLRDSAGGEVSEPPITADGSGLIPLGVVSVAVTQEGGEVYDTHYHFEYVSQKQFDGPGGEGGFAKAVSSPTLDAGSGVEPKFVDQDLPGLEPGETYIYRLVATSTSPGDPVVDGAEQALTAPVAPAGGGAEEGAACPNELFRTGLSAALPDCRAYEQVTPVDKEGAVEILKYGTISNGAGALVGEDGDHVVFNATLTKWGSSQGPYFFSREPEKGWQLTSGTPQPQAGIYQYKPELFSPDLTGVALQAGWQTSQEALSSTVELKAGPPGGPYASISVPRVQVPQVGGWVATSEDFSKLILEVEDRELVPSHSTGTTSGSDLYEYAAGRLRQVNVLGGGETIGRCGARVVKGVAEPRGSSVGGSSRRALSADGSRVFFEAAPGSNCLERAHLYMREAGANRTLDIGPYTFLAADKQGKRLILERVNGGVSEYFLYNTETAAAVLIFSAPQPISTMDVSEGFGTIYFQTAAALTEEAPGAAIGIDVNVYRYDIASEKLRFLVQIQSPGSFVIGNYPSADGRYYYFGAQQVFGVPGAGKVFAGSTSTGAQVYRYDSVENVVECVSCASPFNAEPGLRATFAVSDVFRGVADSHDGFPQVLTASANGDYVFFATAAALLPLDVDGEVPPEEPYGEEYPSIDGFTSVSSDVYEWRKPGVGGCAHLQGCLSLITPGTGGVQVTLLGTSSSGRDVFFETHAKLLSSDNDTAGDIYDARIGGGFAEAVKPVECEGDACSSSPPAPIDTTPASLSFSGPGNPLPVSATVKPKAKPKARSCRKNGCKKKMKRRARTGKGKAGKAVRRAGKQRNSGGHR
jgi:hypothetical protein